MLAYLDARNRALLGYETVFNNEQHVRFVAYEPGAQPLNPEISPPYVYELVYTDQPDLVQLPHGDGEVAPHLDTPPVGYPMPFGKTQHVNCIGSDGHIHELVQNDVSRDADLTLAGDAVPPFAAAWPTTRLAGYMTQRSPTGDKLVTQTSLSSPR
jgi:hypothetical protein